MTREEIEKEFDLFFEFDTDDRSVVTSIFKKRFAEHVVMCFVKKYFSNNK